MPDPRVFSNVVRSVTVSYPVAFLVACLCAVALLCFGIGASTNDWIIKAAGLFALLCACTFAGFAIFRRPELLRSERHILISQAMEIMLDGDIDKDVRLRAGRVIDGFLTPDNKVRKSGKTHFRNSEISHTERTDAEEKDV